MTAMKGNSKKKKEKKREKWSVNRKEWNIGLG